MTSDELKAISKSLESDIEKGLDVEPNAVVLWEIAYQLAKQVELGADTNQLLRIQISRMAMPDTLADPQPGKGDAEAERGTVDQLIGYSGDTHAGTFLRFTMNRGRRITIPAERIMETWNEHQRCKAKIETLQGELDAANQHVKILQANRLAVDSVRFTHFQHYYSTACQHGRHGRCRKYCQFCPEPCLCNCHSQREQPADPETDIRDQTPPINPSETARHPFQRIENSPYPYCFRCGGGRLHAIHTVKDSYSLADSGDTTKDASGSRCICRIGELPLVTCPVHSADWKPRES